MRQCYMKDGKAETPLTHVWCAPPNTTLILRILPTGRANARPMTGSASVSKDGHDAWTRGHPSRRAQGRAPPAITAKPLRRDEVGDLFTASFAHGRDDIGTTKNPRQFPAGGSLRVVRRSGSEVTLSANVEGHG